MGDRYYGLSALALLMAAGVLWMAAFDLTSTHLDFHTQHLGLVLWESYRLQIISALAGAGAVLLTWYLFWIRQAQERENARVQHRLHAQLIEAHQGTMHALAAALDLRDTETWGHSRRVQGYSLAIGRVLGLTEAEMAGLAAGSLLHDVGKLGIPDSILLKAGPLTPEERNTMNMHVEIGHQLVSQIPQFYNALDVIRYHHERYDGKGYPTGLVGTGIPLGARIFAVADAFDAMISARPYRPEPLTVEQAREELKRQVRAHFCPTAVEAFLSLSDAELNQIQVESVKPGWGPMVVAAVPGAEEHDLLTGALTRNHWEQFRIHMTRSRGLALGGVVFVDVDGLKATNESHGQRVGDTVLSDVGQRLTRTVDAGCVVYRYGGDEFVIWCPLGTDTAALTERVRLAGEALHNHYRRLGVSASFSFGMAEASSETHGLDELVHIADKNMYERKRQRPRLIVTPEHDNHTKRARP